MMKKRWIALAVLLVLAAVLVALVCVGLTRANEAQAAVYAEYSAAVDAISATEVHVTENGTDKLFTLADIGLSDAATQAAVGDFSALDRMEPDAFASLGIRTRLNYLRSAHPAAKPVSLDGEAAELTPVLELLQARVRTPAQDARVVFADGKFSVAPEQPGTELDLPALEDALRAAISSLTAEVGHPGVAAVAAEDYYLRPTVTADTIQFAPAAELSAALSGKLLQVELFDDVRILSAAFLAEIVHVDETGALYVDKGLLQTAISGWAQALDQQYVPYRFTTYAAECRELDFLRVDYRVDQEKLLDLLENALINLDFSTIDAPIICFRNGEPFDELTTTYAEVDIDNQTLSYYQNGKCLVHTSVVTGALDGHQTPTGFYHVENKDTDCWLSGPDYLVFVKYWVGFYGPYGLHDSSWRENYGEDFYVNGGSHGCVNTPESAMKKVFDNISVGDAVVVFGKNQWYDTSKQ